MRAINAAELFRAGMHMDQLGLRARNVEQRVTLRRYLAHAPAKQNDEVGGLDPFQELWVRADADIAGVARVQGIEQMAAAERGADRQ